MRLNPFRKRHGFTLMEMLIVVGLSAIVLIVGLNGLLVASKAVTRNTDSGESFMEARTLFERMLSDIRLADSHLTQYPTRSNSPTRVSNETSTVILRLPRFNASGVRIANEWDVVVYRLVPITNSTLFRMSRETARITANTESALVASQSVSTRIVSLRTKLLAAEQFLGDQSTRTFNLVTTPLANDNLGRTEVFVGGVDRLLDGRASIATNRVTFTLAPQSNVPIDVTYPVSSTTGDANRCTTGNLLKIVLTYQSNWRTSGNQLRTRNVQLSSQAMMLNK